MLIAILGGGLGLALTFPVVGGFAKSFPTFFPVVEIQIVTILLAVLVAVFAGFVAALFPTIRTLRSRIADGLRALA